MILAKMLIGVVVLLLAGMAAVIHISNVYFAVRYPEPLCYEKTQKFVDTLLLPLEKLFNLLQKKP